MAVARTLVLGLIPSLVAAQQPAVVPLKPANGTVTAPFTNVSSMHELSDGRVLLSDGTAQMIGVGNFKSGKFTPIPDLNVGPMVAIGGDTTIMWALQPEWVFLAGDRPIGMLPADNPVVKASSGWLYGADSLGHVLTTGRATPSHGDSIPLLLVARSTAERDTVARLYMPPWTVHNGPPPLIQVYDQALLTLDGWVAVLRMEPYRVDWRAPDGRWILGSPIAVPVAKLDQREKLAYMQQRARGGNPEAPETITNWPATVPPFRIGYPPIASLDGKLLVPRTQTADFPDVRYDVINRRGDVERQVTMPTNEHILGFGMKSVYTRVTNNDGTQSVQRHPWP